MTLPTDLALSFTPIPGGNFAGGYAGFLNGGLRSVADQAALIAIPAEYRQGGMLVWEVDNSTMYQLNNAPWAFDFSDWSVYSSFAYLMGDTTGDTRNTVIVQIRGGTNQPLFNFAQFSQQRVDPLFSAIFTSNFVINGSVVTFTQDATPTIVTDLIASVGNENFLQCQRYRVDVLACSNDIEDLYAVTLELLAYRPSSTGTITKLGATVRTNEQRTAGAAGWTADLVIVNNFGNPIGLACQITGDAAREVGWLTIITRQMMG